MGAICPVQIGERRHWADTVEKLEIFEMQFLWKQNNHPYVDLKRLAGVHQLRFTNTLEKSTIPPYQIH
jgi:hypothetical protein